MVDAVPVLTIDGPSGTGKGTIAARLANVFGWHILDSGAFYRAFGYLANRRGISPENDHALRAMGSTALIEFQKIGDEVRIFVEGSDVSETVRGEEGGKVASVYAAIPAVRSLLLERQRAVRRPPGLIADGRDMGTVVFPDAFLKIFLQASPKVRAQRRYKQLKEKGFDVNLSRLEREIAERDHKDTHRAVSPLAPAEDAVTIDTSNQSREEVTASVLALARSRLERLDQTRR